MPAFLLVLFMGLFQQQHPAVCAAGVRDYGSLAEVPAPYDTLRLPPGPPIRVHSEDEARAAEQLIHQQAGSVGATGLVTFEEQEDDGSGTVRVRRRVLPVFVPSDTTRAYAACKPH